MFSLWKNILIILSFIDLGRAAYNFLSKLDQRDFSEVSQCIIDIVKVSKYYHSTITVLEITGQDHAAFDTFQSVIVKDAIKKNVPIVFPSQPKGFFNEGIEKNGATILVLVYIESCETLVSFRNETIDMNLKYLIILHSDITLKCNDSLLETARRDSVYDITFVFKDMNNLWKIATCIPEIDPKTCKTDKTIDLKHINSCDGGVIQNKKVFPYKKPTNWMKCPLNVGMASLYPYIKTNDRTTDVFEILDNAEGSDVEIMKIVADYYNASVKFYHTRAIAENIRLDLSFVPLILNGTFEVCAGGLYRDFGDIVEYSGIYSRQVIMWVFTAEREDRSWSTFVKKINGIYIFIIFYVSYSLIWNIFCMYDQRARSVTRTLIYGWGALVGATSLQDPRTLKQKILNFFYLMLCLHLSAYVSIQLYSFLTIQGPPYVYKDTDDISRSGKEPYLKDHAKYFVDDQKYISFANTSKNCDSFEDCENKTLNNNGVTLIIDGLFAPLQASTAINDEARILRVRDDILFVYHEMLIRKESPLVGSFEKVILRLFEAGICQRLYDESIGILVIDKAQRVYQNIMSNSYSCQVGCKITLSQSAGVFYLWLLGCLLSFCVFMLEILFNKPSSSINS